MSFFLHGGRVKFEGEEDTFVIINNCSIMPRIAHRELSMGKKQGVWNFNFSSDSKLKRELEGMKLFVSLSIK